MSIGMDAAETTSKDPVIFEEFFELGKEETSSPFLTQESRSWAANLSLRSALLAALLLAISFFLSFFPEQKPLSHLLLTAVYFIAGMPSLIEAIEDLASFEINIDILMTLAAFSSVLIGSGMEGGLLLVLFSISGSMEDVVTNKAKGAISSLHKLSPTKACVIEQGGVLLERSLRDIRVDDKILIRTSQIVPLDGVVIDGISSVNLVHLTGENMPVTKQIGDTVPAGARNMEGTLTLKVLHTSSDSTLAKIIQLVTQAQEERPVLQQWFSRLSKGYAMSIIGLSALFALTFPYLLNLPFLGFEGSIYRSLAFLIAASPCALVIAIPIAYLSAVGACARQGILLKGGITLDALAKCKIVAFDKTGTLTTGKLQLIAIEGLSPSSSEDLQQALSIAYALERHAVHPIAKAMVAYGQEHQLPNLALKDFRSVPGYGLTGIVTTDKGDVSAFIGNHDYILPKISQELGERLRSSMKEPQERGELLGTLLIGNQLYLLRFQDTLRPHMKETIDHLKHQRYFNIIMLTGDHENSARRIAKEIGIENYKASLKPEDKLSYVSQASASEGLAMVGDGINDAPALARATVGICMGKVGSTAAIDAADVILLHDNIERIGWLFDKAHQTTRIVKQNLALATLAILCASIPALVGVVPLWLAVVLHEGGTVLVGLNGLRLLKT